MKYLTRRPINIFDVIAPQGLPRSSEIKIKEGVASPVGTKQSLEIASSPSAPRNDENNFRSGASVLFVGIIRNHSSGRKVLYLEYEAYEEMAEQMIQELILSTWTEFQVEEIKILHRLGRVELGEIAVAVSVESVHRDEAYQASRYLIEEIKHKVPIWKKEYFEDGTSEWSLCPHVGLQASA